ncbi:NAD(P)H-dependent FMN reductase [Actinocatenispora thailandica]|uniref:NAD(P)H-dependent FMN reductase n=1 Tax=Actinocatenispora thailandica TaxID=227318 RepID=A0A7R7DVF3_9ACTN|nr:NADPH-dependent FMN reductase [Actinocatenispora thailandica]BCJ38594.1 NAD(P)H-dependent FMN reductase [Actinocatenispora thailandica]
MASILGISGSLRAGSYNGLLLASARKLQPGGLDIGVYSGLPDLPPYQRDLDVPELWPAPVVDLRRRIQDADGLLIATPEYNYGVPGVLKNALDWASTDWTGDAGLPLRRKPIAIMGASSTRFGTVRAQLALRQVFVWTDSDVIGKPEVMVSHAHERFDEAGNLTDETTAGLLEDLLDALAARIAATGARA